MALKLDPRTRARLNSIVMGLLLLAVAAMLAWLSTRYSYESDWTAAGRHSLSKASKVVLAKIHGPLVVTAYARQQPDLRDAIRSFVDRYQRDKPNLKLNFVNPDAVPDEVRNLGISVDGEMVLRYHGRVEHVRSDSEQEFTNALQRLLRNSERWIAFLEGHGERSTEENGKPDLSQWVRQLKSRGFKYQPLNLAETRAIPDNTSVLVIAGPRTRVEPGEINLIRDYLQRGGNLLWLKDPGPMHGLEPLAQALGVNFPHGTIIDTAGQLLGLNDPTIALVTASLYGQQRALQGFRYTTFFPMAGEVVADPKSGWTVKPLLTTGSQSWLETSKLQGAVSYDPGSDTKGPLTLGLSLERDVDVKQGKNTKTQDQRVAVIGDGDFLSNAYLSVGGNLELGMRIINWLCHDDNLINIPAHTAGDTQLRMSSTVLGALGIFFLLVLPLSLLFAGVSTWWRRSKL